MRNYHERQRNVNKRYVRCKECNEQMPQNRTGICSKCNNNSISNSREGYNQNEGDNETQVLREQLGGTMRYGKEINKRNNELKNQGYLDNKK